MEKLKKYAVIFGVGAVITLFQNCGDQVDFSTSDPVQTKGEVVLLEEQQPDLGDGQDGNEPPVIISEEGSEEGEERECSGRHEERDSKHRDDEKQRHYICIIEGPGKSQKIGYINNVILVKEGTPSTVCMTRRACEEIIAVSFNVKAAKHSGYCGKNKHTIQLSDEKLMELLDIVAVAQGF